jgi:hypothetical protein
MLNGTNGNSYEGAATSEGYASAEGLGLDPKDTPKDTLRLQVLDMLEEWKAATEPPTVDNLY